MDLPISSTGTVILATEAIIVTTHPIMGPKSERDLRAVRLQMKVISLIGNDPITIYGGKNRDLLSPIRWQRSQGALDPWVRAL
jgi:hypothetical protein